MSRCIATPFVALILGLSSLGCQSIPERPLDLPAYLDELNAREIDIVPVHEFAAELAARRGDAATAFDVSDGIHLAEAEAIALWFNGDLRIQRLEAERAGAIARTAGRWSDPEAGLGGGAKWFAENVDTSWIAAGSLGITIPVSGRLGAERGARSREYDAMLLRVAEAEWRTIGKLRIAWFAWDASRARLRLLREQVALLDPFEEATRQLAAAGEVGVGTAGLFAIERIQKQALLDAATHDEVLRRAEVTEILGLLPDAPVALTPNFDFTQAATYAEDADTAALQHPAVLKAQAEYAAAEARLRFELRKQYPDITLSPSVDANRDETELVFGLGFPIPVWNANAQGIAAAVAERDIAQARAERALQSAIHERFKAEAALEAARARRVRLTDYAGAEVDRMLEESRQLLRAGEADLTLIFEALTQAYNVKSEIVNATMEERIAASELDLLANPNWPVMAFDTLDPSGDTE